jgi:hypothetical protein
VKIESQIIVDFGLYFQKHQKDIPLLGLTEQAEADSREVTENVACYCGRPDCLLAVPDRSIYDDRKVDLQLAEEFFSDEKSRLLRLVKGDKSALSDDQLRLLPNKVYAFVLRNRKWCTSSKTQVNTKIADLWVHRCLRHFRNQRNQH